MGRMLSWMFLEALVVIATNRLRSSLTMLGIVIGVAAVTTMLAVIEGATREAEQHLRSLGSNVLFILSEPPTQSAQGAHRPNAVLTLADVDAISAVNGVARVSPLVAVSAQVTNSSKTWNTSVHGSTPAYFETARWNVGSGALFNWADVRAAHPMAVLGRTVSAELFGDELPIGKTLKINGRPFRVCGVLTTRGWSGGTNQDDIVIVPLPALQQRLSSSMVPGRVDVIRVQMRDYLAREKVQRDISALLSARHHKASFTIGDMSAISAAIAAQNRSKSLMLGAIGLVSLIVGGIGIMNVMLVSVAERTREIGIRKALGATPASIVLQFTSESLVLALGGCMVGITLSLLAVGSMNQIADAHAVITGYAVMVSVAVSLAIGLFFGIYPAMRAARLDPITALRAQ